MAEAMLSDEWADIDRFEELANSVTDVESLKHEASEAMNDHTKQFGRLLIEHFPIEDGMPSYDDLREFLNHHNGIYEIDEDVLEDVCVMMEQVYDTIGEGVDHAKLEQIQEDVANFVIAKLRSPSKALMKELVDAFERDGKTVSNHEAKVSLTTLAERIYHLPVWRDTNAR